MRIGIMQPYFFPYIGYFQLINLVDIFVIYDNIEYTKKGWINRNRILKNNKDALITLPLKKDSDFLFVNQRELSDNWEKDKFKLLNLIETSYKKAPNFNIVFPFIKQFLLFNNKNLFDFILNSITEICKYLEIKTKIINSSTLNINNQLKSQEKVINICEALDAKQYINPIGGTSLYDKKQFLNKNIELNFIKTNNFEYKQFDNQFIPFLSIIDVIMFNSKQETINLLNNQFEIL